MIRGALSEASIATGSGRLHEQVRQAGSSVAFGPRYVHDVRNLHDEPAVSVHAYSAPLTSMTFYDLDGDELVELATIDTDDPEIVPSNLVAGSSESTIGHSGTGSA